MSLLSLLVAAIMFCQSLLACQNTFAWPINMSDNAECVERLQWWLYAWQFNPKHCASVHAPKLHYLSGLGSSLMESTRLMSQALESSAVYRPAGEWIWADPKSTACQLGFRSIDCFTLPLSVCNASQEIQAAFTDDAFNYSLADSSMSVCDLAREFQKPTLWVIGNLIRYHLRFSAEQSDTMQSQILTALHGRTEARPKHQYGAVVFHEEYKHKLQDAHFLSFASYLQPRTTLSAGIHVRAGRPDGKRRVLDVAQYLAALDRKAEASVQAGGPPLAHVYLCSNVPGVALGSLENLYQRFPRNYTYQTLPHMSFGNAEAEHVLRLALRRRGTWVPPARDVFMEYVIDVEVLTRADIFIGTHSNVYAVVAALRLTLFPERPLEHTCFLDPHQRQARLVCEGSEEARRFWLKSFGKRWHLVDGTPFLY
eukprot:EG_transcript_11923